VRADIVQNASEGGASMVDVFVSYASEDRDRVRGIVADIEAIGCSVWWDREIGAGSAFDREIEKAIDEAHCIVVVWSRHSVESEWVRTEANEGLEKGTLVPVAIEPVKPPLAFRRTQTIDYATPDARASLVAAIVRLLPAAPGGDALPCVGRARELERVEQHLARTRAGEGGCVLFAGEAGVGKTRLSLETGRLAQAGDCLVLRGHCLDMDAVSPYQPLLEQIAEGTRALTPEQLRRTLGDNATEISRLMPELRQRFPDIPPYPTLPPDQERRYLLHGIGEFIARAAVARPLVLVFEDLHWADESTCILLRQLAERVKKERVLLVGTYRDTDLAPTTPFGRTLQDLVRERLADVITLGRLSRTQLVELLVRRYAAEPPEALVELVYAETEGNPFFVEEVLRHLQDAGKLLTDAGRFRDAIEIADTEVPRSVRLIIEDRIGRVSPGCRDVLTLAAVSGRTFEFDLLVGADAKRDEDALLDAVEEGVQKRLIEDVSADRIARYRFVHEQIRQTLLATLSLPRRQRLHLRVADALEALHAGRVEKAASEIGHHLYNAGSAAPADRTARQLTLAGERAFGALAFEDALRHFDLALAVLARSDDHTERARLNALRAAALRGAERIPESLEALAAAIALSTDPGEKDAYRLQRSRLLLDIWRGSETVEELEALLVRARAENDPRRELDVQSTLSRAYYVMSLDRTGFAEKCRDAYRRTVDLARAQGDLRTLATALVAGAQLVDYWPEDAPRARVDLDEAARIGRETGDEEISIDAATARLNISDREDQEDEGERILQRILARRDPVRLNAHYFRMMWGTLGTGRLERCVEICDAGIALAQRIGAEPVQYPTIKSLALMQLGRFADAHAALDAEVADSAHRFGAALQSLGRMQYEDHVGDHAAAIERSAHVIAESKVLNRAWMLQWTCELLAGLAPDCAGDDPLLTRIAAQIADTGIPPSDLGRAAIALARGDVEGAERLLTANPLPEFRVVTIAVRLDHLRLLTDVLAAGGRWAEAQTRIDEALAVARAKQLPSELWQLLARLAKVERGAGRSTAADAALAEARSIRATIAGTIADPRHRSCFLGGARAVRLGLV
jgi:tetratricopeptide (TPR) repeat protein